MSTILQRRRGSRIADSTSVESPPEPPRPPTPPRPQRRRSFSDHISSFPHDLWTILSSSYFNILLIFVPFALPSDLLGWSSSAVFATNFLALIPLALLLSYSTRQGSKRLGSTLGGLINITFGNATELIVGIAALLNDEIKLIQTTLMGSILSTLLFVLPPPLDCDFSVGTRTRDIMFVVAPQADEQVTGVTFVVGGIKNAEYNDWVAQTMSSMMFVATVSLILPTAFEFALPTGLSTEEGVLGLSRGTAVILLILYVSYIFFQMKTHHEHFSAKHRGDSISVPRAMNPSGESPNTTDATSEETPVRPVSIGEPNRSTPEPTPTPTSTTTQEDPVGLPASLTMTILAALATSICSDNLVGSINGVVLSSGMSKTFFGLILIPIVGNAGTPPSPLPDTWIGIKV